MQPSVYCKWKEGGHPGEKSTGHCLLSGALCGPVGPPHPTGLAEGQAPPLDLGPPPPLPPLAGREVTSQNQHQGVPRPGQHG